VVGSDPALAAQVVRMANAAAYTTAGRPVRDLPAALNRLGHGVVRSTATGLAVRQMCEAGEVRERRVQLGLLWKHSLEVAALSHVFARRLTGINPDEAMLAGLVHDIGRFYLVRHADEFSSMCADEAAFEELADSWHTGIGRAIVEAWYLSEQTAVAVDEHESLEREHPGGADLADVVLAANLYAKSSSAEPGDRACWDTLPAFRRLKLDSAGGAGLLRESAEEVQAVIDALKS